MTKQEFNRRARKILEAPSNYPSWARVVIKPGYNTGVLADLFEIYKGSRTALSYEHVLIMHRSYLGALHHVAAARQFARLS